MVSTLLDRIRLTSILDRLGRRGSIIIITVALAHIYLGISILHYGPEGAKTTSLLAVIKIMRWAYDLLHIYGSDRYTVLAVLLLIYSILSVLVIITNTSPGSIAILVMPQHIVLGFMAAGGPWGAAIGMYLDGTKMDAPHIINDQISWMLLFFLHSYGLWVRVMPELMDNSRICRSRSPHGE